MIFSLSKKLRANREATYAEFIEIIEPLLEHPEVLRLNTVLQHFKYTRLRHCLDVASLSFTLAKLLGLNAQAVARAGLLHDLFFLTEDQNCTSLLLSHPRIALENARGVCDLTPMEEDIILKHMFLLTPWPPRYREGYLVTLVDKYCAAREFAASLLAREKIYAAPAYK